MTANTSLLPGMQLIDLRAFEDERGFFMESYNEKKFREAYGIADTFVQDNHSHSIKNVLRGLHYQVVQPQGKLVRVLSGSVLDVAVDLRRHSPTFGKWAGITLHASARQVLWIPKGFAHGFLVLSPTADFLYKASDYYHPEGERCLLWNDPTVGIQWPPDVTPLLSAKDLQGKLLQDADVFP